MPEPGRITVLWHQECAEGKELAAAIFRWFRGNPEDPGEVGRGIPVHYRCLPEDPPGLSITQGSDDDPGAAIPSLHIAVPLVDEHMVVDPDWRAYLAGEVTDRADLLVPVALEASAYQLPFSINRLNYLRLDRAVDSGSWSWEQRTRVRRERLLSLLAQVVARELPGWNMRAGRTEAPPRIKVFISHAKADGAHEAEILRSAILGSGQLQAFYDESDLPIGYPFERLLDDAAGGGDSADTQAMVVVYSDTYPSRPWCQREVRLARKPRPSGDQDPGTRCWRVKPLVIAAALAGAETRMLSEAGQVPLIAWDPNRVDRIVDILLREILLLGYNERRGLDLLGAEGADPGRHAVNCVPDVYLAMEIAKAAAGSENGTLTELLIPPPGLPRDDRELLGRLMSPGTDPIPITTFDEAELRAS